MQTSKNQIDNKQATTDVLEKIKQDLFIGQYEPGKLNSLRQRSENIKVQNNTNGPTRSPLKQRGAISEWHSLTNSYKNGRKISDTYHDLRLPMQHNESPKKRFDQSLFILKNNKLKNLGSQSLGVSKLYQDSSLKLKKNKLSNQSSNDNLSNVYQQALIKSPRKQESDNYDNGLDYNQNYLKAAYGNKVLHLKV